MEQVKEERSNFVVMLNNLWVLFLVLFPTAIIYTVLMAAVFTINSLIATILTSIIGIAIVVEVVKYIKNREK